MDVFFLSRGRLEDCVIGMEYAGVDNAGQRVMGMCENRYVTVMQSFKSILFVKKIDFKVRLSILNMDKLMYRACMHMCDKKIKRKIKKSFI
jgi:hypothetical protein